MISIKDYIPSFKLISDESIFITFVYKTFTLTTAEKLKNITDRALFEKISAAVLRQKFPQLVNMIESGINEKAESVKSPLDGFSKSAPNEFSFIEYTTDDSNLKEKWLHDPSQYKGKKTKDPKPAGDLRKAIAEAKTVKKKLPRATFIIYLVTNQKVDSNLSFDCEKLAEDNEVRVVIIELSILSSFLDNDSSGQWIRKKHLGIEAEIISKELILDISNRLIQHYAATFSINEQNLHVRREFEDIKQDVESSSYPLHFIGGESGMGKSSFSFWLNRVSLEQNSVSIWIDPQTVIESVTVENAIFDRLLKIDRNLFTNEMQLRDTLSQFNFVYLIVDDINQFSNTKKVIEKLISWNVISSLTESARIKIVCPVWPSNLTSLQNPTDEIKFGISYIKRYSNTDSLQHIQKRIKALAMTMSTIQARKISEKLNHDPLLIDLFLWTIAKDKNYNDNSFRFVVNQYINTEIENLITQNNYLKCEVEDSLDIIGIKMLQAQTLSPQFYSVTDNMTSTQVDIVKSLLKTKKIIYMSDIDNEIFFRHDRVRNQILSNALKSHFRQSSLTDEYNSSLLSDPFFSEIIYAALPDELSNVEIEYILSINPAVIFLHYINADKSNSYDSRLLEKITTWNTKYKDDNVVHSKKDDLLSHLFNSDNHISNINSLTIGFANSHLLQLVGFKNGDLLSGLRHLAMFPDFEPMMGNTTRNEVIGHVKSHYYTKIHSEIKNALENPLSNHKAIPFLYLMAGYWKSPDLAASIYKNWNEHEIEKKNNLDYALWSMLQCFDEQSSGFLKKMINYWHDLPNKGNDKSNFPRGRKNMLIFNFEHCRWNSLSDSQNKLLSQIYSEGIGIEIILSIFFKQDSIPAIEIMIDKMVEIKENLKPGHFSPLLTSLGRTFSIKSNNLRTKRTTKYLKKIWLDKKISPYKREFAFSDWCANSTNEEIITACKSISKKDTALYSRAIFQRTLSGDKSVGSIACIELSDRHNFLEVIYKVWSSKIFKFIDEYLKNISMRGDNIILVPEFLCRLPAEDAEFFLKKYWEKLSETEQTISACLFIATTETRKLAAEAFKKSKSKSRVFKYISHIYGCFDSSKEKYITLSRMESLIPYFEYFNDRELNSFAHQCTRSGYFDFLKTHLYTHLKEEDKKEFLPSNKDIATELDEFVTIKNRVHNISSWYKRLASRGIIDEHLIEILDDYFMNDPALNKFVVACDCVRVITKRKYLKELEMFAKLLNSPLADELFTDTEYAVKSFTFN